MTANNFLSQIQKPSHVGAFLVKGLIVWAGSHGLKLIFIFLGAWILIKIGRLILEKTLRRVLRIRAKVRTKIPVGTEKKNLLEEERLKTLQGVGFSIIKTAVWSIALVTAVSEFGINTGPLLAGIGIVGLALGMGARTLIQDYISGIFLLLEDHYRVGEKVEIGGVSGVVKSLDLRKTVLQDDEGVLHYITNSQIKKVTNFSRKIN